MEDFNQSSMLDVAYSLMTKKKKAVDFYKLWAEVSEIKGFTEEEANEKESLFYTNITLDGRFITIGENQWDLRERHKFESVHIDMNDIYADEEENEDEEDILDEEDEEEDEEDDEDDSSEEDEY